MRPHPHGLSDYSDELLRRRPYKAGALLRVAGYERMAFERYDTDIYLGCTMDDVIEFAMALGPASEIIRLAGAEGKQRKDQVVAALRKTLPLHQKSDGIWERSSSWFVTARNPAH